MAGPRPAVAQPVASPQTAAPQPQSVITPRHAALPVKPVSAPGVAQPSAASPRPLAKPAFAAVARIPAEPTLQTPAPVAAASASQGSEFELSPDELVGTKIGNYTIEAKIGNGSQGGIYRATQTNMGRHVRFYTLDRARAQDPTEIQRFIANASVKANVAHPSIFAVYEAGESGGIYFYSCEYVPCRSLRQLREAGITLDENTALQVMKVVSEVLGYFVREGITHNLITENAILLSQNNRPRVANIAAYQASQEFDQGTEMAQLGSIVASALPEDSQALGIRAFTYSLAMRQTTFPDWPSLAAAVAALEPKVAPEDAYKLDAQERAAIRMVEEAKKRQKKGMIVSTLISLALLAAALGSVYWFILRPKGSVARNLDRMIEIPAGEFIYQNGEKVTLPTYYIDQYEVTIAQYAEFLKYLTDHPDEAAKFDHPNQPKGKSHVPVNWATRPGDNPGYYERAQKWGKFDNAPLDVNCPVFGLDWFDAYAFAKWKGKRLPTEKEWEKAARGVEGFKYPWGNNNEEKWANLGRDYDPNPAVGGEFDGHDRWSPVDAMKKDKSPFGVMDMAGNVSEWTADYDVDPKMSSAKVPVIRGGNFKTREPDKYTVTYRIKEITDLQNGEALGFRTVSDTPPTKAK